MNTHRALLSRLLSEASRLGLTVAPAGPLGNPLRGKRQPVTNAQRGRRLRVTGLLVSPASVNLGGAGRVSPSNGHVMAM